jgi:uncharacterized membrane-anchored protein
MNLLSTKRILLAMLIADVVIFGGWIAHEEVSRKGDRIKLPVEGYDPRDLLSGHYVRFQLTAVREAQALALPDAKEIAVCLERSSDGLYHVSRVHFVGDACRRFLIGSRGSTGIDFGIDRFYVDERIAKEVRAVQAGSDTYLIATIDPRGTAHPVDFVMNGNSLGRHH